MTTLIIAGFIAFILILLLMALSRDRYVSDETTIISILFIIVISLGAAFHISIPYVYSDGVRTGTLIKITKKGYIYKTYEGTLNLGGMVSNGEGGVVANTWKFSIPNKELYSELSDNEGKIVSLAYKEYILVPMYEGQTNYLIEEVK